MKSSKSPEAINEMGTASGIVVFVADGGTADIAIKGSGQLMGFRFARNIRAKLDEALLHESRIVFRYRCDGKSLSIAEILHTDSWQHGDPSLF